MKIIKQLISKLKVVWIKLFGSKAKKIAIGDIGISGQLDLRMRNPNLEAHIQLEDKRIEENLNETVKFLEGYIKK